jgi:hypothetical protein
MNKIETLEALIEKEGFDKILKEETQNHCKFTLMLGDFSVMISTPKEEVQVYAVLIFENRDPIFQFWYYDPTFVCALKELIQTAK